MQHETPDAATIQAWCGDYISRVLDIRLDRIDPNVEVDKLGLDSSTAVALIMSLEDWLDIELMPELLFDYPTLATLSEHLASRVAGPVGQIAS